MTICDPLGNPMNGYIHYNTSRQNGRYRVGTQANIACNEDYILLPANMSPEKRYCQSSNNWSGSFGREHCGRSMNLLSSFIFMFSIILCSVRLHQLRKSVQDSLIVCSFSVPSV